MYEIILSSQSQKFLKNCDSKLRDRIITKIEKLSENAFPKDTKRIVAREEKSFRIRVGDYRIIYSVFEDKKEIFIAKIGKRGNVY